MAERITISATHRDLHGDKISYKVLLNVAENINGEKRKPSIGIEHDSTLPPLGQGRHARVDKGPDGEFYLSMENYYYDNFTQINLNNGEILLKQSFKSKGFPLKLKNSYTTNKLSLVIDENCFNEKKDSKAFIEELKAISGYDFNVVPVLRKSVINDPLITFVIPENTAYYILGAQLLFKIFGKAVEKLGEKLGESFYDFLKKTITTNIKYLKSNNRPVYYSMDFDGKIQLQLVLKTNKPDMVIEAYNPKILQTLYEKNKNILSLFPKAEMIQFLYLEENGWEFNYLICKDGSSVGTKVCFDKRRIALKKLQSFDPSLEGTQSRDTIGNV